MWHQTSSIHIQLDSSWMWGLKISLLTFSSTRAKCAELILFPHSARVELNAGRRDLKPHIQIESSWVWGDGIWCHTFNSTRAEWLPVIADNPFMLKQCIPYSARIDLNISLVRCSEYELGVMICDVRNVNSLFIDQFNVEQEGSNVCFEKSPIS